MRRKHPKHFLPSSMGQSMRHKSAALVVVRHAIENPDATLKRDKRAREARLETVFISADGFTTRCSPTSSLILNITW
jgi:hypothetical protein